MADPLGTSDFPAADEVASPEALTVDSVRSALRDVVDPELGSDIVSLGMVRSVEIDLGRVEVGVALTVAACPLRTQLRDEVTRVVSALPGVDEVVVETSAMSPDERSELMGKARRLAQERSTSDRLDLKTRVLGVVSGKGGVGKSSVTVNLAVALATLGYEVGLLDADIWGFSVPRMLGITGPLRAEEARIIPHEMAIGSGHLRVVSMGFLSGEDDAIMWRGLVLNRAVQHFFEDVAWGHLDYLLVDMPPGTGDVQMGLARMVPRTELLVVTTPALGAQKVAGRAADMARKSNLRLVGVIENMAGFTCAHGETYALFGSGGGARLAAEVGAPLLASIPIDPSMAAGGDAGRPTALDASSPLAPAFAELARKIVEEVAPPVEMAGCSARLIERVEAALGKSAVSSPD